MSSRDKNMHMENSLCSIGVDTNYWFVVLREKELKKKQAIPVTIWHQRLVLYRDELGKVHTLSDRCAHRKVALHPGEVRDCRLVCPYHGWEYNPDGKLAAIPYWAIDKELPKIQLRSYPTECRNGLIWVFPGDSEKAAQVPIPDTSELETDEWFSFCLDNEFHNHYSIGIINGMDYYHFHLHRKFQPWSDIRTVNIRADQDSVVGEYEITSTRGFAARFFKAILGEASSATVTRSLKVHYLYPHHLAELGDQIKVWAFFLPVDQNHVKAFITMYIKAVGIQRFFRQPFQLLFSPLLLKRIQVQDAWVGCQEQTAWELYPTEPRCEINQISIAAQELMIRKWSQYLLQLDKSGASV
jgi:renierapurpurin 18,18'-hydroxylase